VNGEMMRLAEQVGIETPINSALTGSVRDMAARGESSGRHTPAKLCALLGLADSDRGGLLKREGLRVSQHNYAYVDCCLT